MPNGDPLAHRLLAHVAPAQRGEAWHLLMPCGRDLTEGMAIVALLETLGPTRKLGRVLRLTRTAPLLDGVDRLLKRARGRLGRFVPDVPAPQVFP